MKKEYNFTEGKFAMPILSMFYGIIIRMYFADNKQHHAPHIHAEYAEEKAVFSIVDGTILAGKFTNSKTRLARHGLKFTEKN